MGEWCLCCQKNLLPDWSTLILVLSCTRFMVKAKVDIVKRLFSLLTCESFVTTGALIIKKVVSHEYMWLTTFGFSHEYVVFTTFLLKVILG